MIHKDYSATPLSSKLGAKPGVEVLVFFTTSRAELEPRGNRQDWQAVRFVYRSEDRRR